MPRLGIMQGRLVPPQPGSIQCFPRDRWREEFALAAEAGLQAIEWIDDVRGADVNPLATDAGIGEMQTLSRQHGVAVVSLCADYFLDRPIVSASPAAVFELTARLNWLVTRCGLAGITRVVLPFVDAARIDTPADVQRLLDVVAGVKAACAAAGIELHLETALAPHDFARVLDRIPEAWVRVTYDSGNSASLGYDVTSELAAYGERIGSVHIKDRVNGGGTVPLGSGDADLPTLLAGLARLGYQGDYVLQVARGADGHEVEWARRNRLVLVHALNQVHASTEREC